MCADASGPRHDSIVPARTITSWPSPARTASSLTRLIPFLRYGLPHVGARLQIRPGARGPPGRIEGRRGPPRPPWHSRRSAHRRIDREALRCRTAGKTGRPPRTRGIARRHRTASSSSRLTPAEPVERVDGGALAASDLEVQMGREIGIGPPDGSDGITLVDVLSLLDVGATQRPVN